MTDNSLVAMRDALRDGDPDLDAPIVRSQARLEDRDPTIRAFVEEVDRKERLDREVSELRRRIPDRETARYPLLGVPVGVKDIFHVRGVDTGAGSAVPSHEHAGEVGTAVRRIRAAGGVVLGKTVTTEFAYFEPGPTRNPHDVEHTPGGSSSGSAAAVAAGMCPLALGTQTAGSVIRPAAFCGTIGVKPSYGRIPVDGVIPFSPSLDHVGFFTADVDSARLAASVLCDDWSVGTGRDLPTLGVPASTFLDQASEAALRAFENARSVLQEAGYEIRMVHDALENVNRVNQLHRILVEAEGAMERYRMYEEYSDRISETLAGLVERGLTVSADELAQARSERFIVRDALEDTMSREGVDMMISPAAPGPAPRGHDTTGDPVMNVPWTYAGLPAITVPAGTVGGLPVGMQCVGKFWADEHLLGWTGSIHESLTQERE